MSHRANALVRLDADDWAWLLPHVREVCRGAPDEMGEDVDLAELPTGRLAGGSARKKLSRRVAASARLWGALEARVGTTDAPEQVLALFAPEDDPGAEEPRQDGAASSDRQRRERLRRLRDERDAAVRQAEGERARAQRLADQLETAHAEIERLSDELEQLRASVADAEHERARALERERRRHDAELRRVQDELTALRRAEHERTERERQEERAAQRPSKPAQQAEQPPRVVAGRPTRLPEGVEPGTREAAELLLGRGRLVVVDGYNVTRQHRDDLDLEAQRTWLVQLATSLCQRRGVRVVIVFDGQRAGGSGRSHRDVDVRFTGQGITADDEIVLMVEATDEPVVVITDDRELIQRVRASQADVLATGPFVWVAR